MAGKWVDNSVINILSNFVGVEPIRELERSCRKENLRKNIPCPQIVQQYNRSMGGVDLADMLLSLYRIPCKTKRWYQKIFWHLIDMAKINAWILYRRHFPQTGKPHKDQKSLLQFSLANKVTPSSSRGRPTTGKKPTQVLPITDVRFDQVAHRPSLPTNKNICRLCSMTCRMQCSKCKIFLCLLADRDYFVDFHTKP